MIGRSQIRQGAPINTGNRSSDIRSMALRGSVGATPTPTPTPTTKPNLQQQTRQRRLNMDLDLFDIVQGYLLDEGYAETEEAALQIMANMSEEWKQSIVEGWAEVRDNVTDPLPWNRNTKYTTKGELRKPGENIHGQQTGRGLNTSTSVMTKDGNAKTNRNPNPLLQGGKVVQQNIPSGVFPPLMPKPNKRGREFSHGS
jgi:hypothetical protein